MYFLWLIRQNEQKSLLLLHLLTITNQDSYYLNVLLLLRCFIKTNMKVSELKKAFLQHGLCKKYKY